MAQKVSIFVITKCEHFFVGTKAQKVRIFEKSHKGWAFLVSSNGEHFFVTKAEYFVPLLSLKHDVMLHKMYLKILCELKCMAVSIVELCSYKLLHTIFLSNYRKSEHSLVSHSAGNLRRFRSAKFVTNSDTRNLPKRSSEACSCFILYPSCTDDVIPLVNSESMLNPQQRGV